MPLTQLFEDFGSYKNATEIDGPEVDDALEEERLKSFESGYGAGWEDAIRAQSEGNRRLHEALEQSLLDLSFTKEEALQAYIVSVRPMLESIVTKVLPHIATDSLRSHIAGLLQNTVLDGLDPKVEVHVSAAQQTAVARVVQDLLPEGGTVRVDSSLSDSQARLALGVSERHIDLDDLITEIRAAISDFHAAIDEGT